MDRIRPPLDPHQPEENQRSTRAQRAFVVHIDVPADGEGVARCGRVEHVVTGRSARFEGADALIEFMRKTLVELEAKL